MRKKNNSLSVSEKLRHALPLPILIPVAVFLIFVSLVLFVAQGKQKQVFYSESDTDSFRGYASMDIYSESGAGSVKYDAAAPSLEISAPVVPVPSGTVPGEDQRIIKSGNLKLEVESVESAAEKIYTAADIFDGRVEQVNIYETVGERKAGMVVVRVPSNRFDEAMRLLKSIALSVKHETSNAQDVTKQIVDMEARLRNLRAEEDQYRAIMDRSGEIKDVLQVVSRLAEVRGQIERMEAQLATTLYQVELSTITVEMTSSPTIEVVDRSWEPVLAYKQGAKNLVSDLQMFFDGIVVLFFKLPIVLLWIALLWIFFILLYRVARYMKRRLG